MIELRQCLDIVVDAAFEFFVDEGPIDEIRRSGFQEARRQKPIRRGRNADDAQLFGITRLANTAGQLVSVHVCHVVVGDDEIDRLVARQNFKCLPP
ncbi:hypothetical protein D3C86_1973980 [compost metagenome]